MKSINFSGKDYKYDVDITFDIPRELLRMFVYSIGRIAYNFDVKGITNVIAQNILEKINKQLKKLKKLARHHDGVVGLSRVKT